MSGRSDRYKLWANRGYYQRTRSFRYYEQLQRSRNRYVGIPSNLGESIGQALGRMLSQTPTPLGVMLRPGEYALLRNA